MLRRGSRPHLKKPFHGGMESGQFPGLARDRQEIIDFSANINPLGPSLRVKKALEQFDPTPYPDPLSRKLIDILAGLNGVSASQVVPGNGATQLIHLLAQVLVQKGDRVLIFAPTFGEYEFACRLKQARVSFITAREENGFQWDISIAEKKLRNLNPALVFLCNPNNPTGVYLDPALVERLAHQAADGLLIVDESYVAFTGQKCASAGLLAQKNVILLRSMTKDYALAGLRLGYILSNRHLAETIRLHQPSWSVSAPAQIAGLAALADPRYIEKTTVCIHEGRAYLKQELAKLGLRVFPSEANFLLVKVEDGTAFQAKMLSHRILVRDCTSFGLPKFIRISVRTLPECQQLVAAVPEVLGNG